jgi:hypothetical protein
VSLPDGTIVGASTFLRPAEDASAGRPAFLAHRWTVDRCGRRYAVEPWAARVEGIPRDVEPWTVASRTWWARINWFSDIVPFRDGRWLSTISMRFSGDSLESSVAIASDDEGRTWRYLSTVAGPEAVPGAGEGFDEPCLLMLETGEELRRSMLKSHAGVTLMKSLSVDLPEAAREAPRKPPPTYLRTTASGSKKGPDPVVGLVAQMLGPDVEVAKEAIKAWDGRDRRAAAFMVRLLARDDLYKDVAASLSKAPDRIVGLTVPPLWPH